MIFRAAPARLWSRSVALAALGFVLNLIGVLGSAIYVDPAQTRAGETAQAITLQSARSRMIRAATSYDNLAEHVGSLLFSVSLPSDASEAQRTATGDLMMRALDRRHDGVRSYLAALAVAGAIDYPAELQRYEALVAAESANFNIDTYRAANAFEADLAMRMVKAEGEAAMKAITLQRDRKEAKRVASERNLELLSVAMLGSTLAFVAALAGAEPQPRPPASNADRLLAFASRRLGQVGAA